MKGVIVQVGKPKSIVLFNNGRIAAISTPADCHVGMVVTVRFNRWLKTAGIILAGAALIGLGLWAGFSAAERRASVPAVEEEAPGWQRGLEKQREIEKKFSP